MALKFRGKKVFGSAEHKKERVSTTIKGYDVEDVRRFLFQGNNLGLGGSGISPLANPNKKSRTDSATREYTDISYSQQARGKVSTESFSDRQSTGFQGQFATISDEQMETLVTNFQNRQNLILGQKRTPGRQQLLLSGR